jgi:hypothetical protein
MSQSRGRTFLLWIALGAAAVLAAAGRPAATYLLEEYHLRILVRGDVAEQAIAVERLGEARSARAVKDLLEYLARSAQRSRRVRSPFVGTTGRAGLTERHFPVSHLLELDRRFLDQERGRLIRQLFTTLSEAELVDLFGRICRESRSMRNDITCHDGLLSIATDSPKLLDLVNDVLHLLNECCYGDPDVLRARLALSRIGSRGLLMMMKIQDDPSSPAPLRAVAWLQLMSLKKQGGTE